MAHVLQQKMTALRRRVRRLLVIDAAARLAAVALAVALALGTADYLLRFEDRGIRWLSSLALASILGWMFYRFVRPVLQARLSDVELALQLERRLPILRDRLASAMRFLREPEDDVLAGSAVLRRTVIAEATAEIDRLNLDDAVESHAAQRSAWLAVLVFGVLLTLAVLNPSATGTALARLACPWGATQWPRQSHLVFEHPMRRLAIGQTFEVELKDAEGARLPDDVYIQYRFDDSSSGADTSERMRLVNDALLARKEHVTRPFSYRAVGGDDFSMPWIDLEIVEPPEIEELSVKLHYPEYTGWASQSAEPHLRALVGTHVELTGRLDKPATAVKIHVDDASPLAARLNSDGLGFSLSGDDEGFRVERSGSYWIEVVDREGFSSGDQVRYEIRAVEDFTPAVVLDRPPANAFVTPRAKVPVHITAKDDLALEQVALRMSRSDRSQDDESEVVVYQGPPQANARMNAPVEGGESREIEHLFDLAALSLKPATQVTLYATATDYYPHRGQSESHRLTIVTADELRERLAERQNTIVGELARILKLQRDARSLISGAEIQLAQVGRLEKHDIDHVQGAELIQRQIERGLVSPTDGVLGQIGSLLDDLVNNQLDSPDVERRMQSVFDEVDRLGREELPPLGGEITAALKAAHVDAGKAAAPSTTSVKEPLTSVGRRQDEVVSTLERLTASLAESDSYRRFHREISTLRRQQQEIERESGELARRTLTKELSQLSAQERANLEKLAARQLDLARQFDKIQQRMQRTAEEASARDPLSAGSIAGALAQAREQGLSQLLHESGREVAANQFGQAIEGQRRASEGMQEMLDILANRREHELGRLVKKLREAQERLSELREQQQGLQKKWRAVADETNEAARRRELERLTREQQRTAEATERLARSLERLQAERAGQKASQGGAKMNRAGSQGQQGQAAAAADAASDAQRDLEQAEQELANRLAQAEADLAQEQMARLEDHLQVIVEGQRKLLEETRHYADVEHSQGELTRAQAISVGDLGKQQRSLEQDTTDLAEKLGSTPVFRLAFEQAARQMQRAAAWLGERQTGTATQQAEQRAIDLIEHALEALKPATQDQPQPQQPEGDNAGQGDQAGQQNSNAADATQMLAEMKLLKWMQDDVNARTKALDDSRHDAAELTPAAQQEYQELSEQQGLIADLLLKLARPGEADEEEADAAEMEDDGGQ
jgi:hypothetical protein